MESNLKKSAISGVLWSGIQKIGVSAISLISNIVLARLLAPEDFGCIGMLAIFIYIANSIVSGGFVSTLIQKKDAGDVDFSTVFYCNLVSAIILYVILFLFAPFIASFYAIEKLSLVLRIQGIVLIINALSVVQSTLLRKNFEFGKYARISIIASVVSVVPAIIMAYNGWGVWALVSQQLILSLVSAMLLWCSTTWHPSWMFSWISFKSLFGYGCYMLLSELLNSLFDNIQGLLIGKKFNASIMGYYSQAKKLEEVPTQSISQMVAQVTFPLYSEIQENKENLKYALKKSVATMNFINFPLMLLLLVIAKPIFVILFSDKWLPSVACFQILCIAGLVNCMQSVNYQVVAAVGQSKQLFKWNVIKRIIGICLMFIGIYWGINGILWAVVLSSYITFYVNAWLASKSVQYSVLQQVTDALPLLSLSTVAAMITSLLSFLSLGNFLLIVMQTFLFIAIYITLAYSMKRMELYEVVAIARNYIKHIR